MKKRTDEEKRALIDEACDLFREAEKMIEKAKMNLHLCGIETCGGFTENVKEWEEYNCNVLLYSGIKKLESITAQKGYFPEDCITKKPDKRRMLLKYGHIVFLQLSDSTKFIHYR